MHTQWELIDFPHFEKPNTSVSDGKYSGGVHDAMSEYILVSDFVHTDISYECISTIQYQQNLFSSCEDMKKQFEIDAPRNIIRVDGKQMNYSNSSMQYFEWMFNEVQNGMKMAVQACTQAILAHPFCLLNEHLIKQECIPLDCAGSRVCIDVSTENLGLQVHKTFKIAPIEHIHDFEEGYDADWKNVTMTLILPDYTHSDSDSDVMYLSNIIY